jgi:transposase-like protein
MGLSRRQFTKEFKLAAVRRLEEGISIAEVARGLEVNPNVLHRWRREFRQGRATRFREMDSGAGRRGGLPSWSGRSASRRWRSIS